MFVERSEAKMRAARTAFVVFCLLPCAALAAWAAHRASDAHRRSLVASWARSVGLDIECDAVVHVRPGCVRIGKAVIRGADGTAASIIDSLEVETTPDEIRVRVPDLHVTPAAAAVFGRLAGSWLTEPVRHDRAWLLDIESVRWSQAGLAGPPWERRSVADAGDRDLGFRIECVASGARRAIRLRREPATDDEIRIVRSVEDGRPHWTVEGRADRAVPTACLAAAIGAGNGAVDAAGGWCSGTIAAETVRDAWSGRIDGRVERFSASSVVTLLGSSFHLGGTGRVDLAEATFADGRVVEADATLTIDDGDVSQELIDRLVQVAQCRAGEAYRLGGATASSLGTRPFDRFACRLRLDRTGLSLRGADTDRGMVSHAGKVVLDAPADRIEPERLLWAFAPRDARPLPASPATAWLEPLLPAPTSATRR